jgi:hypothetical protein
MFEIHVYKSNKVDLIENEVVLHTWIHHIKSQNIQAAINQVAEKRGDYEIFEEGEDF